ncbi:MAG: MMPL family transporter [bacterium]|nr:MMPL family transporter [bacterium]
MLSISSAIALSSGLGNLTADFDDDGFLRAGDDTLAVYDAFRARYGRDDRILVGIEAPDIFDLQALVRLRDLHEAIEQDVPHVAEVMSLVNARDTRGDGDELIVDELLDPWPNDALELAIVERRAMLNPLYLNTYFSHDGRFAAIVVELDTYTSLDNFDSDDVEHWFPDDSAANKTEAEYLSATETRQTIRGLRKLIKKHQSPEFRLDLVGGAVLSQYMQEISTEDVRLRTMLSVLLIAVVLLALFRRISGALLPLLVVSLSTISTFGAMGWIGVPFTIVTQILPSFLIVVGICDAVHVLALVYQRLSAGDSRDTAVSSALGRAGLPIVLTSLTTAAGLFSFVAADITPVAEFGVAAPVGVLLALFYSVTLLPALLVISPWTRASHGQRVSTPNGVSGILLHAGNIATTHPRGTIAVVALLVVAAVPGVSALRLSNDNLAWLFEDDPMRMSIERIDRAFEGTERLEILVNTRRENGLHEPDHLRRIDSVVEHVMGTTVERVEIGSGLSIVDIVEEINQALHENQIESRTLPNDRRLIAQELLLFENSGTDDLEDVTDSRFQEARLTFQARIVDSMYYVPFIHSLESALPKILGPDIAVEITGKMALRSRAFAVLLGSLLRSYGLALLIISPLMILMVGSVRRGVISMIPNLLPVYFVLALMGWLDIPLNISTMLVGSIVIGLAVDDTIHFVHGFDRHLAECGHPATAVRRTLETTGRAMLVTTIVLCVGFFVLLFGSFKGTIHLGILAGSASLVAFLADVIVAPALMMLAHPTRQEA